MKRIVFVAALSLAGCAANADDVGSAAQNFTEGDPETVITTTREITIDLQADVQSSECTVKKGWFIEFDFQGHHFSTYAADDLWSCQSRRLGITGVQSGQLVEEQHKTFVKRSISIENGRWIFTSYEQVP